MKCRTYLYGSDSFTYDATFEHEDYNDLYVGTFENIELFTRDVLLVDGKFYRMSHTVTKKAVFPVLIQISIRINRNPKINNGVFIDYAPPKLHILYNMPQNFKLIGNLYQSERLNI